MTGWLAYLTLILPGDWHTAYILLYAPLKLEVVKEDSKDAAVSESSALEQMDTNQPEGEEPKT